MTDAQLVEGCRRGRAPARQELVHRFAGLVHWAVRKTAGRASVSDANELTAEAFQECFRKWFEPGAFADLREPSALKNYLIIAACRTTRDLAKARRRRRGRYASLDRALEGEGEEGLFTKAVLPDERPDPGAALLRKEEDEVLESVIRALGPRERFCLEAHYLEGLPYREISEILGVSAETVTSILHRTRERIRQRLEERGFRQNA
jgi:RNA polymerase sigma-70 factor (ECF subfamily)